ncbi:NUDIX hydrolase [Paenibacillus sp. OV219]|uniref:NUDIX hydrolase n=1 Tax=Paenibacillus sp. OV219 TaxID=1884377 RepID=UPI0008B15190|nr:NUDIX hydrolase [Paenibacillus sp. OV219]SEO01765.1 aminoglycoside 6'-N-acetyltransferase [Paenibacillus sp. OV219]
MNKWYGAAGVCMNEQGQLLMVLQGKREEEKSWSVPSGGMEKGETLEDCCIREVYEETGYRCEIKQMLRVKEGGFEESAFQVTYYEIEVTAGSPTIHDPDGLIHAISWHSADMIRELQLSFEEDRSFLLEYISKKI